MALKPLDSDKLYHRCDLSDFGFTSTNDLTPDLSALGQQRAMDALQFAVGMHHDGYNLFVSGSTGVGRRELVSRMINERAKQGEAPQDWVYVHNFERAHEPCMLCLPKGAGQGLRQDMQQLIERLLIQIPATFKSDEYRNRVQEISDEFEQREESQFQALGEKAHEEQITLMRTPSGYTLGPLREGKLMTPDQFKALPEAEQTRIKAALEQLNAELTALVRELPKLQQEHREAIRALDDDITHSVIDPALSGLRQKYGTESALLEFLDQVHQDMIENVDDFFAQDKDENAKTPLHKLARSDTFRRYRINVLVSHDHNGGSPVVVEDIPSYQNLVGRIEYQAHFGTLSTDFSLIQPGALHRANGGYLIVDAQKLLSYPFAWEGLKRALRNREIRIDPLEKMYGISGTRSLEAEPMPLKLKVILIGERRLYYLLKAYDPEFSTLFKVYADFNEQLDRSRGNLEGYLGLITQLVQEEGLAPFALSGIERVIEQSSRRVDDSTKLSLNRGQLIDLLREASYCATRAGSSQVKSEHVSQALKMARTRSAQYSELMQEQIERGTIMVATEGSAVGQANGLSVFQLGDQRFGKPARISATARLGGGKVIDIERETELGGPIHTKGVMILANCIGARYARNSPLSLHASLVFEQSYGMVDGDSASALELCVLLSAISGLPIKQSLAVTGSINQRGEIQAIGGVNEKIEGFFELCKNRGLTGDQGVVIPATNVDHLILDQAVVQACEKGEFHIYAVKELDELISLLFDRKPGKADEDGRYPPASVNGCVQQQLLDWTEQARKLSGKSDN
ncbi:ATP-dependent protease La Type II [Marinobacterium lacunae]|uniref:endopeptidase La n=1 Tax=Marinobacterium lacunae TaxID=1232683 RepID=A0A081G1Q8_9GAMM|nr:ATP-binding protein [Marinobacterium lacunae]KEA64713.1 ATP-dependent protease La Type II [Marinobacterium lacunae]MBR9883925.1 AAA family ATPase [Oceanospirillales bacterium]